jgi:hypothetical protein
MTVEASKPPCRESAARESLEGLVDEEVCVPISRPLFSSIEPARGAQCRRRLAIWLAESDRPLRATRAMLGPKRFDGRSKDRSTEDLRQCDNVEDLVGSRRADGVFQSNPCRCSRITVM